MRLGTRLALALCIGSVGPVLADEVPAGHVLPISKDGNLVVGLCDGETSVEVAGMKPGDSMTREQGQQVADALMAEWRRKHPDADWVVAEATTELSQPGPTGASPTAVPTPPESTKRQFQTYGAFTARDSEIWQASTDKLVAEGKRIFHDAKSLGGTNAISCDMCHPDGSNTHHETYPKYQVQLGRVALLRDMINWCIENPVRGKPFPDDDPRLKALEAYILAQRKGVALEYGKH
jgi:thiosulfate dehydrogenase